ncbi:hypothetical protein Agub_g12244 [Astrephomene gubernaculifera]|uniref:Uncharacterized protein n=1 Tax=Astrephomene gubernaculifera TaxID=47775 RepID=A0AAD3DXZ7_9CHLO|nr:hypothetical protein Agub_g12244 [Astrephomene gubernaculifera]
MAIVLARSGLQPSLSKSASKPTAQRSIQAPSFYSTSRRLPRPLAGLREERASSVAGTTGLDVNRSSGASLGSSALTGAALLEALRSRGTAPETRNVYGKPLSKSELSALDAALSHLSRDPAAAAALASGPTALTTHLRGLLLEAGVHKRIPLPLVEGAMVLVELMEAGGTGAAAGGAADAAAAAAAGSTTTGPAGLAAAAAAATATATAAASGPGLLPQYRWQLVVGADVGAVQYIPAVEELQVAPDGTSFTLGTDLDFLFTGFRGSCQWLAPGHLQYNVREVRLELRWPKAWRRAAAWLRWRATPRAERWAAAHGREPDWGDSLPWSQTCREDPEAPGALLPLPFFPTNELLAFSCDGKVAVTRSRLTGGLILLLEVGTRERLRGSGGSSNSGGAAE